jgi:hypothetical protein
MNFRKFNDIGDSEPKPWKPSSGTRFDSDDDNCDEVPGPYGEAESDLESETDEEIDENETETESESNKSTPLKRINKKLVNSVVLEEEADFMQD